MNGKKVLIMIGVFLTSILFGALLLLHLTACVPPRCCPEINEDSIIYPYFICHPDCPGGGEVRVYGSLAFKKEGEFCEPPERFRIYIYNLTKGEELPPLKIDKAKVGVYQFDTRFKLKTDTEFELRAVGEEDCGTARKKFKIRVLVPGQVERYHLVFTEQKEWPKAKDSGWKKLLAFGQWIAVDKVTNENDFMVDVDHKTLLLQLPKRGDKGSTFLVDHQDLILADGYWTVKIPFESEFGEYANLGKPPIKVDIDVRCQCSRK